VPQSVLVLQSMFVLQFVPEKLQLSRSAEQPTHQGGGGTGGTGYRRTPSLTAVRGYQSPQWRRIEGTGVEMACTAPGEQRHLVRAPRVQTNKKYFGEKNQKYFFIFLINIFLIKLF